MPEAEKRPTRPCHGCGSDDDHPRHHHVTDNDRDILHHIDCCAAKGCPLEGTEGHASRCEVVLEFAGDKRGLELAEHLSDNPDYLAHIAKRARADLETASPEIAQHLQTTLDGLGHHKGRMQIDVADWDDSERRKKVIDGHVETLLASLGATAGPAVQPHVDAYTAALLEMAAATTDRLRAHIDALTEAGI